MDLSYANFQNSVSSAPKPSVDLSYNAFQSAKTVQPQQQQSLVDKAGNFVFGGSLGRSVSSAVTGAFSSAPKQDVLTNPNLPTSVVQNLATALGHAGNQIAEGGQQAMSGGALNFGLGETKVGLGLANAAFAPVTAVIDYAQHIPGLGYLATGLNAAFGAIGAGASDAAVEGVNALPISDAAKAKIAPVAGETAALLAQLAAGKVGGDVMEKVHENVSTIVKGVSEDLKSASQGAKAYLDTGPVKEVPVSGESRSVPVDVSTPGSRYAEYRASQGYEPYTPNEQLPSIQVGPKPKETLPVIQLEESAKKTAGSLTYEPVKTADLSYENFRFQTRTPSASASVKAEVAPSADTSVPFDAAVEKQIADYRKEGVFLDSKQDVKFSNRPLSDFNGKTIRASQGNVDKTGVNRYKKEIEVGARPAVLIEKTPEGNHRIVDGHTRLTAYEQLGIKDVPVLERVKSSPSLPKELEPTAKVAKSASDVNITLAQKGFEKLADEEQAKYSPTTKAEQVEKISSLMGDIERSKRIIRGEESVPSDVLPQPLFNAMEEYAVKNGDAALLRDLAKSPIATQLSEAGQALGSHAYNDNPNSAVSLIKSVKKAREAAIEKGGKKLAQVKKEAVGEIKKELKANATSRPTWEAFIKDITCGY